MSDDTDRFDMAAFEDTAVLILAPGLEDTFDLDETDRMFVPRARTQPDWPPVPPPPQRRSRRHRAVHAVVDGLHGVTALE